MKIYSIFDDFGEEPINILKDAGIDIVVHPFGSERPDSIQMKQLLEEYDGVVIGTTQKMDEDTFTNIESPKIIATASVGVDHICVPEKKKNLITIFNTPKANAQSVAEYTIGCALVCCKRIIEGRILYSEGKNNKKLSQKPEDLCGKILGVVGAGNISLKIMEYGKILGMHIICWTAHPDRHQNVSELGGEFVELDKLLRTADIISVNLPNNSDTKNLISEERIHTIKTNAIFISISRKDTCNFRALLEKAEMHPNFYVCLDLDINEDIVDLIPPIPNIVITPHIAGGTLNTRKRMFIEVAKQIALLAGKE